MRATQPARVLQIGLGARGRMWARIVQASQMAQPAAYVEPRPEARQQAQAEILGAAGVPGGASEAPVIPDLDAALRTVEADLALVVTPPEGRRELIQALLARGLHVLAEKPLALSFSDALAVVSSAEEAERQLGVVQNFRYMPSSRALRERVQSGRYGQPTSATVLYVRNRDGMAPRLNKYPLVMDHPMLLEQSIHHLDLLRFVYDAEPEAVSCVEWNPSGSMYRGDACAAALIQMQGGLTVTYHGTWVSGSEAMAFHWRTDFERGVLIQRELFGDLVEGGITDTALQPLSLPASEPFFSDSLALLEDFIGACREGRLFGSSGRDHLRTLSLTLACIESARLGQRVSIGDFAGRHYPETVA